VKKTRIADCKDFLSKMAIKKNERSITGGKINNCIPKHVIMKMVT
jgi:hypothetical protein